MSESGKLVHLAVAEQHVEQRLAVVLGLRATRISAGQTSSVVKRLENSMSCHRSERASPGASTSWCQKCVRRSALP